MKTKLQTYRTKTCAILLTLSTAVTVFGQTAQIEKAKPVIFATSKQPSLFETIANDNKKNQVGSEFLDLKKSELYKNKIDLKKMYQKGGSDRGGGDAKAIRALILKTKENDLLAQVQKVFSEKSVQVFGLKNSISWLGLNEIKLSDTKSQNILKDMIQKGFQSDLADITFKFAKKCMDSNGIEKTAVASMNKPRSAVCINGERLVSEYGPYIQDSDLVALAMHELAHHYGHEDADHSFAAAIALAWQKDSEQKSQDGEPMNSLINNDN